jgi:hypothetical protein
LLHTVDLTIVDLTMCCVQLSQPSGQGAPTSRADSNFPKVVGASMVTALAAAAVAMQINQYSHIPCTVTGDCSQISDVMKGDCQTVVFVS